MNFWDFALVLIALFLAAMLGIEVGRARGIQEGKLEGFEESKDDLAQMLGEICRELGVTRERMVEMQKRIFNMNPKMQSLKERYGQKE